MGTQSTAEADVSISVSDLVRRGGVALVVALLGATGFVTVANAAGVAPQFEAYEPLIAARGAAIGVVGATLVYGVVARLREHPDRLFTIIAIVVYGIGLVPVALRAPGMAGATTFGVALLPVLHAIVAVPAVVALTGRVSWL